MNFFEFINDPNSVSSDLTSLINKRFKTESSHSNSLGRKLNGVTLNDLVSSDSWLSDEILEMDTTLSYSALQYLEVYWIIRSILKQKPANQDIIKIIFFLPNDEDKYYRTEGNVDFENKIQEFLRADFPDRKMTVNIHFWQFSYSDKLSHRPYNQHFKKNKHKWANAEMLREIKATFEPTKLIKDIEDYNSK